jgi:hypothetical protein
MVPVNPCCVTVNVRGDPAAGVTVMVPVRDVVDGLAPAAQFIVASPTPDNGDVNVSQLWLVEAVHCNVVLLVEKVNDPVPPVPATVAADGVIETVVAACVTTIVTGVPVAGVTVMVAVRSEAVVLPVAVY